MLEKIIIIFILGAAVSLASFDVRARADAPADGPVEEPAGEAAEEPLEEPVALESLFDPEEGSGELRAVKEQIRFLLRQNEELASQAQALKQESLDLQEKVARARAAAEASGAKPAGNQEGPEQNVKDAAKPGQPQSLRLLKSYDLQYQKKELELELKLKELASRGKRQAHDRQLAEMRKELEQNAVEEKQLAEEAERLKGQDGGPAYELECLKQENILLENRLKLLKTSPEFAIMGEGEGDLPAPVWQDIRRKEAQREELQQKIARLEMEQRSSPTDTGANVSIFETQFRGSVERLEEENKQLKKQIFSLQEKIQKRSN